MFVLYYITSKCRTTALQHESDIHKYVIVHLHVILFSLIFFTFKLVDRYLGNNVLNFLNVVLFVRVKLRWESLFLSWVTLKLSRSGQQVKLSKFWALVEIVNLIMNQNPQISWNPWFDYQTFLSAKRLKIIWGGSLLCENFCCLAYLFGTYNIVKLRW